MKITGKAQNHCGTFTLAGDKSISHRAIMHAALSPAISRLENVLRAGVTEAMLRCLRQLGVQITDEGSTLTIQGGHWHAPTEPLDCGNSGTTMRLFLGALAGQNLTVTLTGTPGLQRRPMARLADPLRRMGAQIDRDYAPLTVHGGHLHGCEHRSAVASAQVKAGLLLAALQADSPTTIHEPGPSRDHSERMLQALGLKVERHGHSVTLYPNGYPLPATHLVLPGDISSAAFLICIALIVPGSAITLQGIGVNPTRTGILDALLAMGADITLSNQREVAGEPVADISARYSKLHATEISGDLVVRMIDEFPIFTIVMTQATGTTVVREAAELRLKESDRIAALAGELRKLGVTITEYPDGYAINGPQEINAGTVQSHGDHRLAMALAIAGLLCAGSVQVEQFEAVQESFPSFVPILHNLGAAVQA